MDEAKRKAKRNKVDIAIIDGGILDVGILKNKVNKKIKFLIEDESKDFVQNGQLAFVHGTTCAKIINRICPNAYFTDLMVMQRDGTTEISKLLEALDWCLNHEVKLIHLSLGTVNYFDVGPLEECVRTLLENNVIIVAAYNNYNIRTYPAAFEGVFGVRQDRIGILNNNQFLFQSQPDYGRENSIVAHWWGSDGRQRANSYAAPVITGYAAKALCENIDADFYAVLEFLEKNAVLDRQYQYYIESVIHKSKNGNMGNDIENKESVNIPVIAGERVCCRTMQMLVKKFESEGFQVLLLQEGSTDIETIPMEYYGGKDVPLARILYTVNIIYKPDIIFLNFLYENTYGETEKSEIDMLISHDFNIYTITAKGLLKTVQAPMEIYDIICRYF